ncbi:3-keto-steroid reductase, partial [Ascosphaera acerosa]
MTWPSYILTTPGWLNKKQTPRADEPAVGFVFCSNVFGHYMLAHYLMPLLSLRPESDPSRVVFMSSIEASLRDFDVDDFQGLKVKRSYQASKYLTDLLMLTSDMSSTRPW